MHVMLYWYKFTPCLVTILGLITVAKCNTLILVLIIIMVRPLILADIHRHSTFLEKSIFFEITVFLK